MSNDGYTNSALMGNWNEDRQLLKQKAKMFPDCREAVRNDDIKYAAGSEMRGLMRIGRKQPWNTRGCMVDRMENEFEPLTKYSYQQDRIDKFFKLGDERNLRKTTTLSKNTTREPTLQTSGSIFYPLINEKNTHQISKQRYYPQNYTDFDSTLKTHPGHHGKLYNLTSNQEFFMRSEKPDAIKDLQDEQMKRNASAGILSESRESEGIQISSILTGEQFRDYQCPQFNTHVQRSWVYGKEGSLERCDKKLEETAKMLRASDINAKSSAVLARYQVNHKEFNGIDKPTSLPLENGENTFFPKLTHQGYYRKIRSQVTLDNEKNINLRQIS